MGTEQQQEFKSEKPLSKPQRKTIPFKDNSIENWKPKNSREQRAYKDCNFESKYLKMCQMIYCKYMFLHVINFMNILVTLHQLRLLN